MGKFQLEQNYVVTVDVDVKTVCPVEYKLHIDRQYLHWTENKFRS